MNTEPKNTASRIASIDILRGITILTMIFVNDLASIANVPAWMKHMPMEQDGMTFVDLVFPAFLFIVGMSIPFAMKKRLNEGATALNLWTHILLRTAGLILLGILMVNIHSLNESMTGIPRPLWSLLMFTAAILIWNKYPEAPAPKRMIFKGLRISGFIIIGILVTLFRSGTPENPGWLHTSWWGILGLIGWAYIITCAVYYFFRNNIAAVGGMIALFTAVYIGDKTGALDFLYYIKQFLLIGPHLGGHASITTAGLLASMIFIKHKENNTSGKLIQSVLLYSLILFLGGYLLRGLYGINKVYATPTWCLYSAGICCLLFAFLYWLLDLKGIIKWSGWIRPAAANPLLAYILPDIFYSLLQLFGITFLHDYLGDGTVGIARSAAFSLMIVLIVKYLTKLNVKIQL